MAKGHRSQIKRERRNANKDTRPNLQSYPTQEFLFRKHVSY